MCETYWEVLPGIEAVIRIDWYSTGIVRVNTPWSPYIRAGMTIEPEFLSLSRQKELKLSQLASIIAVI